VEVVPAPAETNSGESASRSAGDARPAVVVIVSEVAVAAPQVAEAARVEPAADPAPGTGAQGASQGAAAGGGRTAPEGQTDKLARRAALRERLAQERDTRLQLRARRRKHLERIASVLLTGAVGLALVLYLGQAAILRGVARRHDGEAGRWSATRLAQLRDPGSFDVYVKQLGLNHDRDLFTPLVYQLAGRRVLPVENEDPSLPLSAQDPAAIAEHAAVLERYLRDPDPVLAQGALYALWMLKAEEWTRSDPILQAVADRLDDQEDLTRKFSAMVLSATPPPPSLFPALEIAARDSLPLVRKYAVRSFAAAGRQDRLLAALEDPSREVRQEAAGCLLALDVDVPLDDLIDLFKNGAPDRRPEVVQALAKAPQDRATDVLLDALVANDARVRLEAVRALKAREGEQVRRALARLLRSEQTQHHIRLTAIEALAGRADAERSLPDLLEALDHHGGWRELHRLHEALTRITGAEVPALTPDESSWAPVIAAWKAELERG
jgi:HEAT repeat protein